MFTGGLFLMGRVPKKGLGVAGIDSAFGLGDTEAETEVTLAFGDEVPLGFGLNDEAFTFKRLFAAVVGDMGAVIPEAAAPAPAPEPEPEPEPGLAAWMEPETTL